MVFMNSLPADLQRHIKRFGPRSIEEKVRMAQAFWDIKTGHSASLYDKLPQDLCRKFSTGIPVVQMVSASTEPPEEDTIKPTVIAKTGKTTHEDEMEKITKMFSEMTAHIADLEAKVIRQNKQPRGTFVAEERNKSEINCFLCGRRGHFAKNYQTRSWKEGREREEVKKANHANIVQEIEEEDEEFSEEYLEAYPVEAVSRATTRKTPYLRKKPTQEPEVVIKKPKKPT